jgi:hypothetical protein
VQQGRADESRPFWKKVALMKRVLLLGVILAAVVLGFVAWACSPRQAGSGEKAGEKHTAGVKDIDVGPTGQHP